jgi:hypothetical protein
MWEVALGASLRRRRTLDITRCSRTQSGLLLTGALRSLSPRQWTPSAAPFDSIRTGRTRIQNGSHVRERSKGGGGCGAARIPSLALARLLRPASLSAQRARARWRPRRPGSGFAAPAIARRPASGLAWAQAPSAPPRVTCTGRNGAPARLADLDRPQSPSDRVLTTTAPVAFAARSARGESAPPWRRDHRCLGAVISLARRANKRQRSKRE